MLSKISQTQKEKCYTFFYVETQKKKINPKVGTEKGAEGDGVEEQVDLIYAKYIHACKYQANIPPPE